MNIISETIIPSRWVDVVTAEDLDLFELFLKRFKFEGEDYEKNHLGDIMRELVKVGLALVESIKQNHYLYPMVNHYVQKVRYCENDLRRWHKWVEETKTQVKGTTYFRVNLALDLIYEFYKEHLMFVSEINDRLKEYNLGDE